MDQLVRRVVADAAVDEEWTDYWRLWCGVPGMGLEKMKALLAVFHHPRAAWDAAAADLARVKGLGAKILQRLENCRRRGCAAMEAEWAHAGVELITPFSHRYPPLLRTLPSAPLGLFVKGDPLLPAPAVAVVGTRKASRYGLEAARWLGRSLAQLGIPLVSGLALGVDAAAHRAVLKAEGVTHAVLAHGLHTVAPARHRQLAEAITQHGALLSELPPGVEPKPWHFPVRNRIIAGICHATVVVEAGRRSGALITAGMALDAGREVYAVPGSVFAQSSKGSNRLIADGATPLLDVASLAAELGLEPPRAGGDGGEAGGEESEKAVVKKQDPARGLLAHFGPAPVTFERLHRLTGWSQGRLAAALTRLELSGNVRALPGRRYTRARVSPPPSSL